VEDFEVVVAVDSVEEEDSEDEGDEEDMAIGDTEEVFVGGAVGPAVEAEAEEEVFAEDVVEEEKELLGWFNAGPKTRTQSLSMP